MLRLRFSLTYESARSFDRIRRGTVDAFPAQRTPSGLILRRLNRQIPQANQVVGGSREREDPSHFQDSTMPNFSQ